MRKFFRFFLFLLRGREKTFLHIFSEFQIDTCHVLRYRSPVAPREN